MKLIGIAWWSDSSSASASVDLSLISFWSMHLAFHLDSNILVRFFFTINSAAHECTCVVFVVCQSFQHSCSCAAKGTKYVYTFCVFDFYFLHFFPYLYVLFLLLSSFFFARSQSTDSRYLCILFTTWTWTERVVSPRELKRHYTIPKLRAMYLRRWNTAHRRHLKSNENPYQTQLNSHVHTLAKVHKVCFNPFNHDWYVFALGKWLHCFSSDFFFASLLSLARCISCLVRVYSFVAFSLSSVVLLFFHPFLSQLHNVLSYSTSMCSIAIESFPKDLLMIQNYFTNYILFSHFWCLS